MYKTILPSVVCSIGVTYRKTVRDSKAAPMINSKQNNLIRANICYFSVVDGRRNDSKRE